MNVIDKMSLDNPILYYKLDPGEMGIATPSSAVFSISHVAGHETGNAVRAEAEAVANGGYVIYSAITLDMRKRGAFLAAVAGKTTVEIYYPRGKSEFLKEKKRSTSTLSFQEIKARLKNSLNTLKGELKYVKNPARRAQIQRKISQIENALRMLESGNILQNIESLVNTYA